MRITQEYWNGPRAQKWVTSQARMDAVLEPFGRALLEAAELPESGVVVDVGCGCGATTLMASRARPGLEVIGVDISEPMLGRARDRAADEGLSVRFDVADAAIARPAASVDRILSRFGVMFFDEPVAAFTNMRRWLAPGGRLVALVWGRLADNPWTADVLEILRRHVELPLPSEEGPGPFGLSDPGRVDEILGQAGFTSVEQRDLDVPMSIPGSVDETLWFHCERSVVASVLEDASEPTRRAIRAEVRAYSERHHDGEGARFPARARLVRASVPE